MADILAPCLSEVQKSKGSIYSVARMSRDTRGSGGSCYTAAYSKFWKPCYENYVRAPILAGLVPHHRGLHVSDKTDCADHYIPPTGVPDHHMHRRDSKVVSV